MRRRPTRVEILAARPVRFASTAPRGAVGLARAVLAGLLLAVVILPGCAENLGTAEPAAPAPEASSSAGPKLTPRGAPTSVAAQPASATESGGAPPSSAAPGSTSYVIQPGDQVEVRFLYHPYFNTTVPVRPDGRITLQMVHDVPAAGLTPMQLWYYLTKRYEKLLDREDITVTLKSFSTTTQSQAIYVGGEVALPKMMEMTPGMTVVQALYEAGGLRESANTESVIVLRKGYSAQHQVLAVNVDDVLEGKAADVVLEDRDVVFVPKTFIARADVFVDQYLNKIVPRWVTSAFAFTTPLTTVHTQTQVIPQ